MEYALAAIAFAATCLATASKAHDKAVDVPLHRRINAFGWTAIVLGLATLSLQVYKAAEASAKERERAAAVLKSVFARSITLGEMGAHVEWLALPTVRLLPAEIRAAEFSKLRKKLDNYRQTSEIDMKEWRETLSIDLSSKVAQLMSATSDLSLYILSDTWNDERSALMAGRVQKAAAELNANLCAHSKLVDRPLRHPMFFSECAPDGKEWQSAAESEAQSIRDAGRL